MLRLRQDPVHRTVPLNDTVKDMTLVFADLDWLPGNELWWIAGMGLVATMLAFLLGTRLLGRQPVDTPQPEERPAPEPGPDPFTVGATGERRQAFRRKGSSITVKISDVGPNAVAFPGWVMDRSVGGVGLWSEKKVAEGTPLRVRPDHAPAMTPWVEVEVRTCKEHEGGWHLNCAFVKTPPYTVLLLFG